MKGIIIPDPHAHYEYDNNRFKAAGEFILEERPDFVLCIGDLVDLPSLSSYDRGTRGFEGRRYYRDIEAAHEAQELLFEPINKYNEKQKQQKHKGYTPERIFCMGNHEDRAIRATQCSPELFGTIDIIKDAHLDKHWDLIVPFKEMVVREETAFSHYFASGVMGRPIGGVHTAASLINKNLMSSIQGHSHTFDHSIRTRADGVKLHGMSIGCFVHEEYNESWCRNARHLWWSGLVVLENMNKGDFNFRTIQQKTLLEKYL